MNTEARATLAGSARRVVLLMRNRLLDDWPALAIGAAIVVGVNLVSVFLGFGAFLNADGGETWAGIVALGGVLLASQAFKQMHDAQAGLDWLSLPASPLEQYGAAFALYAIAYPVAATLAAWGASVLLSLLEAAVGGPGFPVWYPFDHGAGDFLDTLIVIVIFLAGSASFRRRAFIKTLAVALGAGTVAGLALLFAASWVPGILAGEYSYHRGSLFFDSDRIADCYPGASRKVVTATLTALCYVALPVFAVLYGYFKVYEKEARDAVQ